MIHLEALRIVLAIKPHCSMINMEALRWSEDDCLFQQQQAYIHLQYVARANLEPDRSLLSWLGKAPSKAWSSSGSAGLGVARRHECGVQAAAGNGPLAGGEGQGEGSF